MSFRRREDSRYQIRFDETDENNYSNGFDFSSKSPAELDNLCGSTKIWYAWTLF